jgi:hypothetical protein
MVEKRFLSGDERLFAAVSLHDTVSTFAYENSGNPGSGEGEGDIGGAKTSANLVQETLPRM